MILIPISLVNYLLKAYTIWSIASPTPISVAVMLTGPVTATDMIAHNSDNPFIRLLSTIKQYVFNGKAIKPTILNG